MRGTRPSALPPTRYPRYQDDVPPRPPRAPTTGKACWPNTIQWVNDAPANGKTFDGVGHDDARRQGLVLHHGQLRARPWASRPRPPTTSRSTAARCWAPASIRSALDFASFLPQAQTQGQGDRACERRRRHHQRGGSRPPSSASSRAASPWWRSCCSSTTHGMGLKVAQGLQILEAFYWDMDDDTRAFASACGAAGYERQDAKRVRRRLRLHAGLLNAVVATGSDAAQDVVPQMKNSKARTSCSARSRSARTSADPSDVPVRSEEAGRVEISVRLLQADLDDFGRAGVPFACRWRCRWSA